ncbi:MAG: phosphotransferase [Actinomycetota bacterium]
MHPEEPRPSLEDAERAERAIGSSPVAWRAVVRGGQTAASRWVATLADGTTRFVKIAHTLDTAAWIRDEHLFYLQHKGLVFLPATHGWDDDGERPALALEDLSAAAWPPPWDRGKVQAVVEGLEKVAAARVSPEIPRVGAGQFDREGWPEVAAHREAFLALGLCDEPWLDACLPVLTEIAQAAPLEGDRLLHMDVRSDNLCLLPDGVRFVDWNFARRGNPRFDIASWLPSLEAEGGPPPEKVVTPAPDMAAFSATLAGYFGSHAARPPIPEAPHVRPLQLLQARTALPWAARALGLPPPEPRRGAAGA